MKLTQVRLAANNGRPTVLMVAVVLLGCSLPWTTALSDQSSRLSVAGVDLPFTVSVVRLAAALITILGALFLYFGERGWRGRAGAAFAVALLGGCAVVADGFVAGDVTAASVLTSAAVIGVPLLWWREFVHPGRRRMVRLRDLASSWQARPPMAAAIAAGFSLVAVTLPLYALVDRLHLARSTDERPASDEVFLNVPPGMKLPATKSEDPNYWITLQPVDMQPTAGTVTIAVEVVPPGAGPQPVLPLKLRIAECSTSPCADDGTIEIRAFDRPLADTTAFETRVLVRLDGTPSAFPFDAYTFSSEIGLFSGQATADSPWGDELPAVVVFSPAASIEPANRLSDVDLSYVPQDASASSNTLLAPAVLSATVSRTAIVTAYVIVVALLPLVFAIVIGQLLFQSRSWEPVDLTGLYAVLAATTFTILPLRVVLVPEDIQASSITSLDLILAADFGFLALLASLGHWRHVASRRQSRSERADSSPTTG